MTKANGIRLATAALAVVGLMGWSLPAQAQGSGIYTVHDAAVILQWATQRVGDDCRRDAENCVDRGRINTRELVAYLCGLSSAPRVLKLVMYTQCDAIPWGWHLAVWDKEIDDFAECNQLDFFTRFAVANENNRGELRQWRLWSSTQVTDVGAATDSGMSIFAEALEATVVVGVGDLPRRLQNELLSETLSETLEGGLEEESVPQCATSLATSSLLGTMPEPGESESPSEESLIINGQGLGTLLIEKGNITAGRAFTILLD